MNLKLGHAVSVSRRAPAEPEAEAEPKRKLDIGVAITDTGPCKKHLKVTIPRAEIDRQYEKSLEDFAKRRSSRAFGRAGLRVSWSSSGSASRFRSRSSQPC